MDIGRASEATRIPYYSDFAQQYLVPAVNAAADPLGIQSWVQGQTLGTDIGAGDVIVPITGLDIALNAATGGGLTGFDDIARMGARGLSAADNIYRAGMPEPQLYPGLSGGLPPPGAIPDPFGNPPIEAFNDPIERAIVNQTYSGQGAIGGEAAPIQGRIPTGVENEAARLDAEMRQMFPQPSGAPSVRIPTDIETRATQLSGRLNAGAPPIETPSQAGEIGARMQREQQITGQIPDAADQAARDAYIAGYGQLNPPGAGAEAIERAIANSPDMSDSQKTFLRGGNGPLSPSSAPPSDIPPAVTNLARDMGVPDDLATRISTYVRESEDAIHGIYKTPQGLARVGAGIEGIARRGEGLLTGNEPNSFINAVLSDKTALEGALSYVPGITKQQIDDAVTLHVRDFANTHYSRTPGKAREALDQLNRYEARSAELARDFKALTTINDAWKNTVAGVADFAVLGINGLVEMAQAGPYIALGTLNRAANNIATMLHHPELLSFERVTGLPNLIAKEANGLPMSYRGEGFYTKGSPTLLGLAHKINPAAPIDKHVLQPIINGINKVQFDMVQGWAKNSISDGLLTLQFVLKFAEGLVRNVGNVSKARDFAMEYVSRPDVLRDIARFTRNATSSTAKANAPGRHLLEDLLPFSAAYTRGQPARMADMAKLIAPGASETQRVLAASAIFSTAAYTLGLYQYANDKFGTTEAQTDLTKPGAGRIVLPGGQVVSMFPQATLRNALVNVNEAIKDKRPED